jgi:lysophospholipase L1-like esterase
MISSDAPSVSQKTQVEPVEKSRPHIIGGLLISLITFLILLGGLELVGYIWEKNTAAGPFGWSLIASRRLNLELHGSEEKPYYLFRPDEDYLWENIPVHINSHGFRTEEAAPSKPDGVYRILTIGDSVTFGWEVQQEETYGKQLEHLLNNSEAQPIEVINAGVPGWSLEASRNFLLDQGFDYQPDAVILSVTVVNDITVAPIIKKDNTLFDWLRDHTFGWPFLTTQARFLMAGGVTPEAIPELDPPQEARRYYPQREDNPLYDQVWEFIDDMHEASDERGIPFVILVFPSAFQVNSAGHSDVVQRVLLQRAEVEGINLVDLLPVFRQTCVEIGAEKCEGYENALFADVWMHPNAAGHRLAAEQLFALWPFH